MESFSPDTFILWYIVIVSQICVIYYYKYLNQKTAVTINITISDSENSLAIMDIFEEGIKSISNKIKNSISHTSPSPSPDSPEQKRKYIQLIQMTKHQSLSVYLRENEK